ncbi:ba899da5-c66a-4abf-9346-fb5b4a233251 [Sclerotinia trifoliorum]|uniref:Ba899da5-c66a-4abf-9346-fb5b4a233251 n=1 Tax=Sclerotinia trifoliorum TaxID=28548 RepID=A0A8H2ZMF5_9HELO|nr:ba899da5-c66a-4abf-9346-fb5b4a233251 [Sclerotinia trifoliorum]
MDYVQPTFQHFSHHPSLDQLVSHMASGGPYNDHQHIIHGYSLSQHPSNMMNMSNGQKTNETKPRLGKEEVDILEREFKRNPKPTTQTKRIFAEDMGVDLARINNWFQNRRAKRKQEKKTEAYEAGQAREALGFSVSAPSSPEFPQNNYNIDYQMVPQQPSSMPFSTTGPPPATAPYNPQYQDPTSASLESLSRTMAVVQAASQDGGFSENFSLHHNGPQLADMLGMAEPSDLDRASFPTTNNFHNFEGNPFAFQPTFQNDMFHEPDPLDSFVSVESGHTPTAFNTFSDASTTRSLSIASASSHAIPQSFTDLTFRPHESGEDQGLDLSHDATSSLTQPLSWNVRSGSSPPPASSLFKSPPPPTDLASRRKKVHVKPAALGTDTMRGRPSMGPRTVSNIDGFRRQVVSPLPSPMRRIASAGGNVLTGRIQKPGIESAQRSPINIQGFENAGSFMEQHFHMIRQPSLTAGSSLTSSLAPPTPMSPRERQMSLKRENSSSQDNLNYLFNLQGHDGLSALVDPNQATDQTPPETPQASLGLQPTPTSGWPTNANHHNAEQHWNYEIPDDPLYTPNHDSFASELSMPHPSYASQPVTPAFGSFNQGGLLLGNSHDSPQFNNNASPLYTLSNQGGSAEYSFPHDGLSPFPNLGLVGSSPTMTTKQKQYQFSNVTPADYSEK